jgi:hypothetical protein
MKTAYDVKVPSAANDVLKKLGGGKVETVIINMKESDVSIEPIKSPYGSFVAVDRNGKQVAMFETKQEAELFANEKNENKQQGFRITPEMQAKVSEGVPLFSTRRELHDFLTGKPIVRLNGDEAPTGGFAKVREWATGFFASYGNVVKNPELGEVTMDGRSVRDSIGHGMNRAKAAAFLAVPDVLMRGKVVHAETKGKMDAFYISAPVVIGEKDDIVTVLVHRDPNSQRMYLHSVTTKENLLRARVSSVDAEASERSGSSPQGGITTVLQEILNFKPQFSNHRAQPLVGDTFTLPAESKAQATQRLMQDSANRWRVVQDAVEAQGGAINDDTDVAMAIQLYPGRVGASFEDLNHRLVEPLLARMAKAGATQDMIGAYLYAKHAPERNREMAKKNKRFPDGGSGMTNADAAQIIADFQALPNFAEIDSIASGFQALTKRRTKMLVRAGVMLQEQADAYNAAYQQYVPLKGFEDMDENGKPTGQGKATGDDTG